MPKGGKGKFMKKNIFKKIVASLATAAMAVGMFAAAPAQEVKAVTPGDDGNLYLVGSIDGNGWAVENPITMTKESDGKTYTYSYDVDAAGSGEFKILIGAKGSWDAAQGYMGDGSIDFTNVEDNGGNMKVSYSKAGNVKITVVCEGTTVKSVNVDGTAVGAYTLPDEFYVVGAKELTGIDWGGDNFAGVENNKLTETSTAGVYTLTLKNIEKGDYEFKIIQTLSWDKSWPAGMGNHTANVPEKSDVTITFTKETGEINVSYKSVATGQEQTQQVAPPQETTAKPSQTTTKAPETTTVPTIIPQADVDKIAASATITGAPADSSLKFSVISENEGKTVESFKSSTLKGMTFQALDIKLLDKDGNAVQPGSKVDITVALTDGLKNAKKVEVFRVDGDKLTSLGQVDAKDGKITFTTDHFSTYVFASVQSANKTGDMSSVAIMFAVAAMAGVAVMAMRKKTVNE